MTDAKSKKRPSEPLQPGPARLFALLAGAMLSLLGVLGFFYDASFGTGLELASDDLAGILNVNGWRNLLYLVTGLAGLALAARRPRATALGLGALYLVLAIWGFAETERGIGSILDSLPLGDNDNALHLVLGVLGLGAALIDGPLPAVPERLRSKLTASRPSERGSRKGPRDERGARRRGLAGPRRDDAAEPR